MKKLIVSIILIITLVTNNIGVCLALEDLQIKYGTVSSNEIWSGNLYIISDIVIPENVIVTVEANSQLNFANYDILNKGKNKNQSEIIIHGAFDIKDPVKLSTTNDDQLRTFSLDDKTQVLKFYPYKINTEKMRSEFRDFKNQYLILWSLITVMWVLRR